jgi:hypothetical protein
MVGLARGLWPIIAVVAIAGGTVWLMYAVWRSPHRNDLASFGSYAAAIAVIAGGLITRAVQVRAGQRGDATSVPVLDHFIDALAGSVKEQWTRAAADGGLLEPEPIPVR